MAPAKSAEFEKAAEEVKKLKKAPSNDEKLELYGYFKQGTQDPPFSDAPKPGTFDLTNKYKYNAWQKVSDLSAEDAQKKYIELVEQLKEKYGFDG